ncbi:MAG TPA: FAD-dependent oxidoreductase [Polyangiaceae bacterium]|nr:FAD-dependent oxidoreductase [Polyangiaceae bacterium]
MSSSKGAWKFGSSLSRRGLLVGAAGLGAGTLLGCGSEADGSQSQSLTGRKRVAVLGGGAGGLSAAYFLGDDCDVDIFESRSKLGGHCDSRSVDYAGQSITVDLGAQFFSPGTHPIYVTLLEELGLYDPDHPDRDETLEATGSICLFPVTGGYPFGSGWPRFCSTYPLLTPFRAIDFAVYSQVARDAILGNISWEMRLDDWIASLPVSNDFKNNLLFPWISALIGTTHESAAGSSARSILQTFALSFPSNIFESAKTFNSKIGLGGNLDRLVSRSTLSSVKLGSPVQQLAYDSGQWLVTTPGGTSGPYDAIVMNVPPHTSKDLLSPFPWAADTRGLLSRYEFFDARLVVHTDPVYLHRDLAFRTVYNGGIDGAECEGSVWLGGIHPKLPNGRTVDIYKSWAMRRRKESTSILHQRNFRHPRITPDSIRAARSLASVQGQNGLYFSGQHTLGFDLQEAALYSAIKVADAIAPSSPKLASLRARLQARGRTGISYDL